MSTNYPGSLDSFSTKEDGSGNIISAAHMNNVQAAIIAVETELGTDPAGTSVNVKTRLGIQTKIYRALITQAGTNAPTASVLENTLGGTVVWSRVDPGYFSATLNGVFTIGKCFYSEELRFDLVNNILYHLYHADVNSFELTKMDSVEAFHDNISPAVFVEIFVYP